MSKIKDIKNEARSLGACRLISEVKSVREAVELLQTPQGREFAIKTGFPTLDAWRQCKDDLESLNSVLLDSDANNFGVNKDCIAVGKTRLEVIYEGADKIYHIIAMHGAEVKVIARQYAVVNITAIDSNVEILNDGTAIINIEEGGKE